MKNLKKLISFVLTLTLLVGAAGMSLGGLIGTGVLAAEPFTGLTLYPYEDETAGVNWWKNDADGRYYFFMPYGTDLTQVKVATGGDDVEINGVTLHDGDVTDLFSKGTTFTMKHSYYGFSLVLKTSANIPSVYITTESGSLDYIHRSKENKEKGSVTIVENGEITMSGEKLSSIKGRGNSTWGYPKKPYNIKFEKKTALFGMDKAKKWSLLASYLDRSYLRNPLAFHLSEEMGLHFTPEYQFIDLYINNDYMGSYLATESVEVGSGRVDIADLASDNEDANPDVDDLEDLPQKGTGKNGAVLSGFTYGSKKWIDIPNDPADVTGGYLLETDYRDRYAEELSGFVSDRGQCIVIKAPECASKAEVDYISAFFNEAEEALYAPDGFNSLGKHYSEYYDIDALARMYILEEFTGDDDAGMSSCYFYKDRGSGKLVASPAWDFDLSLNNPSKFKDEIYNSGDPGVWVAQAMQYSDPVNHQAYTVPTVFNLAFRHEDFRSAVETAWLSFADLFSEEHITSFLTENAERIRESATSDIIRWQPKILNADTAFSLYRDTVADYAAARTEALDLAFSENAALLYYDVNGGTGFTFNTRIVPIGDEVKVNDLSISKRIRVYAPFDTPVLRGWTQERDGSGRLYKPGEKITLTDKVTVLYAQWDEPDLVYGDIDKDNEITSADARLALRGAVGLETFADEPGTEPFLRADVDLDDEITAADARLILRAAVGIEDPAFIAGREPVGPEEPTTDPEEPTSVQEEPTTGPEEPTSVQEEPTTGPEEPTSVQEEPTTGPEEPTSVQEEPTTGPEEPTSVQEEPTIGPEEPTTGTQEPTSLDPEPIIDPGIPVDPPVPGGEEDV